MFKLKVHLFLLVATVYLLCASGTPWIEADYQLQVARNLLRHHSLSAEKPFNTLSIKGINGRWYDYHGMTNVFVLLPVASLEPLVVGKIQNKDNANRLISFLGALTGIIVSSLISLVFFSTLLLFKRPLRSCLYATLCLAFLTIFFPYSSKNYEASLNALFMLSALYFLFAFCERKGIFNLICSGAFAGLALNTRDFSLIFVFCVFFFLIWMSWREKDYKIIVVFLVALAPFLFYLGWTNWLRTGVFYLSPIAAGILRNAPGYGGAAPSSNILLGLRGLLFSKGGSIFVYSPVCLISLFGLRSFIQNKRLECLLVLSIIMFWLLALSKVEKWFGFTTWGPRYTIEITPLLMLPLGYCLTPKFLESKFREYFFIVISVYSVVIQLAGTLTNWHARVAYILGRKGEAAVLFTIKYSQWFDSVKNLFINLWNLLLGQFVYLENPGFEPALSSASLYTSTTIFTWWNRLWFLGISIIWIGMYLVFSFAIILYSFFYLRNFLKKAER